MQDQPTNPYNNKTFAFLDFNIGKDESKWIIIKKFWGIFDKQKPKRGHLEKKCKCRKKFCDDYVNRKRRWYNVPKNRGVQKYVEGERLPNQEYLLLTEWKAMRYYHRLENSTD